MRLTLKVKQWKIHSVENQNVTTWMKMSKEFYRCGGTNFCYITTTRRKKTKSETDILITGWNKCYWYTISELLVKNNDFYWIPPDFCSRIVLVAMNYIFYVQNVWHWKNIVKQSISFDGFDRGLDCSMQFGITSCNRWIPSVWTIITMAVIHILSKWSWFNTLHCKMNRIRET